MFPYNGNVIIPTDELIFSRGVGQPPTRIWYLNGNQPKKNKTAVWGLLIQGWDRKVWKLVGHLEIWSTYQQYTSLLDFYGYMIYDAMI